MIDKIIIFGLLIHFLADFALQTHDQAIGKSKEWLPLIMHTYVYSLVWFIAILGITNDAWIAAAFFLITFIVHTFTDYITSREVSKFFNKKDYHNGFVVIGFDQILHYLQLYYTFKLLCPYEILLQ